MTEEFSKGDEIDLAELPPLAPGEALRMIFVDNMGLSLNEVGRLSGVSAAKLFAIAAGNAEYDRDTSFSLRQHFGNVATTLDRMKFIFEYHRDHHRMPAQERIYKISP